MLVTVQDEVNEVSGMVDVNKLLTVRETAKRLGLSEYTVRQFIREKQLRATKIKRWRIAPEDLDVFVKSRTNTP
jgi:excisionase family DNA binding protein